MRKSFFAIVIFLISQSSVSAQPGYYGTTGTTGQGPHYFVSTVNVNLDSLMLDSVITAHRDKYSVVGIASMIVKDGKVIWDNNYGYRDSENQLPVNDSTLFAVGSISKTFVGTSVMQLWQRGMIDLDSSINKYLPDGLRIANPYFPNDTITVRMLVTHTSSLQENTDMMSPLWVCDDSPIPLDSFLAGYLTHGGVYYSQNNFFNYPPGQQWNYTNVGYSVLASAVQHLTGKSFSQYCQDSIFTPLAMNSSYWFLAGMDKSNLAVPYEGGRRSCWEGDPGYPAGRLRLNKPDMVKYLTAYMNYGTNGNVRILDSATVASMLSDQIGYPSVMELPWVTYTQGLSWWQQFTVSETAWSRGGSDVGALAYVSFDPKEKWFTIWFQNFRPDNSIVGHISEINKVVADYAYLYGNIYAVRPSVYKRYARKGVDSVLVRTTFSNRYRHQFTSHLICVNSDRSAIDSVSLFDDGMHGDLLASDGIFGGYIPPQQDEDFYSLGVSTIDNQTGKYFNTPDIVSFTTAGPLVVVADTIKNRREFAYCNIRPYVRNRGNSATVTGAKVKIYCDDPWVKTVSGYENPLPDIPPGETVGCSSWNTISYIDSLAPDSLYFNLRYEITIGGLTYWTHDTLLVGVKGQKALPVEFSLEQNYPNPFNPVTNIRFGVRSSEFVVLKVYDVLGREVRTLVNERKSPGTYEVRFDGSGLSSGVYFYRIKAGAYTSVKKMLMLK